MRIILKIFKYLGVFLVLSIVLIILSGLIFRLTVSEPIPTGKLIDVSGTDLHIVAEGNKNDKPTLVLESGATGNTDMFHWIAEGLKKNMRIVRYDREGKWFSEPTKDSITPEYYARQLHELLEKSGEKPPYILAGHSMGGLYIRIFRDLYPNEVSGMVFIDSSHPEQWKRLNEKVSISKSQTNLMKLASILGDMGILGLYNSIFKSKNYTDGLPKECHNRTNNVLSHSGKVYKRALLEMEIDEKILLRAAQTKKLGSLPILVFTAKEQYSDKQKLKYKNQGIDPNKQAELWFEMQNELKELSTNSKQMFLDASHGTIITKKENAEKINEEILLMADNL